MPVTAAEFDPVAKEHDLRNLPRRAKGNLNEALLMKRSRDIGDDDNQWPDEADASGFRAHDLQHVTRSMDHGSRGRRREAAVQGE